MKEEKFKFKLKGKTLVCIDWANVYGWQENLELPEILSIYLKHTKNRTSTKLTGMHLLTKS